MIVSVLKVIGIILLIILFIIIFIVGLVLFSPICYDFSGNFDDNLTFQAKVKWRPVLLKANATGNGSQISYTVKLFGGVVMTNTGEKLSWLGRKFFDFGEKEQEGISFQQDEGKPFDGYGGNSFESEQSVKKNQKKEEYQKSDYSPFPDDNWQTDKENDKSEKMERNEKNAKKQSKPSFFRRIKIKLQTFREKCNKLLKQLKKINRKREALLQIYHSRRFEQLKKDIKQYAVDIFRIIKPDRLEGKILFGLEDPATTGQILGVIAMILPLYQGFLTVEPDFTQQIIKGDLKGKGKIRLIFVVKLAIKVILNKNLIKVTKKVQTILEA
jgi:hypothetical protein